MTGADKKTPQHAVSGPVTHAGYPFIIFYLLHYIPASILLLEKRAAKFAWTQNTAQQSWLKNQKKQYIFWVSASIFEFKYNVFGILWSWKLFLDNKNKQLSRLRNQYFGKDKTTGSQPLKQHCLARLRCRQSVYHFRSQVDPVIAQTISR